MSKGNMGCQGRLKGDEHHMGTQRLTTDAKGKTRNDNI